MPRTFDLDAALSENRPMVILRGQRLLIADLPARKALVYQRKMQAAQEEVERKESELEEKIRAAAEDGEALDAEEIQNRREEIAEQMQDILSQAVRLMLEKPVERDGWDPDDPDSERWKKNDEGRIVSEPLPDEIADTISMQEFRYIEQVVTQTGSTPVRLEPVEEGKGT